MSIENRLFSLVLNYGPMSSEILSWYTGYKYTSKECDAYLVGQEKLGRFVVASSFPKRYRVHSRISKEIEAEEANYYQTLIK
jgi:hypothetical protein